MAAQLKIYEAYARVIRRMLLFSGLWPGPISTKLLPVVVLIHTVTSIVISIAIINFISSHITNLSLVTKGVSTLVSFFTVLLKVMIFSINRDALEELHETLETTFQEDLSIDELQPILLSPLGFFYRPTLWVSSSTWAIIVLYFVTPFISISTQRANGVTPIKYRLPFPTQYPWTISGNSILYPIHYAVEGCAGCAFAGVSTATDSLFGFYIFQMASQFRTLSYRIANLKPNDDYHGVMKECALRHQTLSHCRDKLQRIYGPIILWMLMTSAMNVCANIFQASQISFHKGILVMVYITAKLMQTLLYGWYGLFLTTESEDFRQSVYCSGWTTSGDKRFLSNTLIMLMYKPLVLTACRFSVVSLDMFITVTNTALSYFFLLRTLDEGQ